MSNHVMIHDGECPCECAAPFLDPPRGPGSGQVYLGDLVRTGHGAFGVVRALHADRVTVTIGNHTSLRPYAGLTRVAART